MVDTPENTPQEKSAIPTANGYPKPPLLEVALGQVLAERVRQEEKWGESTTLPVGVYRSGFGFNENRLWLKAVILQEEVGEVARAILDHETAESLYMELAQVAAVSIAFMESILEDQIAFALDETVEETVEGVVKTEEDEDVSG